MLYLSSISIKMESLLYDQSKGWSKGGSMKFSSNTMCVKSDLWFVLEKMGPINIMGV